MNVIEGFKLAPQQGRLWRSQRGGAAFRAQCAILLKGALDSERLKGALERVVSRHETLRTVFRRSSNMDLPLQIVHKAVALAYSEIPPNHRAAHIAEKVDALMRQERMLPLGLDQSPLLRFLLVRATEHQNVLLLTLPSLSADAWTL